MAFCNDSVDVNFDASLATQVALNLADANSTSDRYLDE